MTRRSLKGIELMADPMRREIVARIAVGAGRPSAIARAVGLSKPATSRQLRILTEAGLLRWTRSFRDLRGRFYMIEPSMAGPILAWLAGVELTPAKPFYSPYWSRRVDRRPQRSAGDDPGGGR